MRRLSTTAGLAATASILALLAAPALRAQEIDPAARITGDGGRDALFGAAAAMSRDTAIVGAPFTGVPRSGEAYLFDARTGARTFKLTSPTPQAGDLFGIAVDVSRTTALVGAPGTRNAANDDIGAAFLYDTATGFQTIRLNGPRADSQFGESVALTGGTALVGAPRAEAFRGEVQAFDIATGALQFTLIQSFGAGSDRFGDALAADGAAVVVGAPETQAAGTASGSAYVYDLGAGGGAFRTELFELRAEDAAAGDGFGSSVAVAGSQVLVGAPGDDDFRGAAYLFDAFTGAQQRKLVAQDRALQDLFGGRLALENGLALIGADNDDDKGGNSGSLYVFHAASGSQLAKLTAGDGAAGDGFGGAVAASGNRVLIGAAGVDTGAFRENGAGYLTPLAPEWIAPFGGDYDDDANWAGPLPPSVADGFDVTINPDFDQTITGPAGVDRVGRLALGSGSGVATLELQRGGGIIASGDVEIGPNGRLTGGGGVITTGFAFINNAGVIDLSGGLGLNPGALLSNRGTVTGGGSVPSLFNDVEGTVFVAPGTTTTFTEQAFNAGRFAGGDATLVFEDAQGLQNARGGSVEISGTRTDIFGTVRNFDGGTIVNSGGGTLSLFDALTNDGELRTARGGSTVIFGDYSGRGTLTGGGEVFFEGDVSTGSSPALVEFSADIFLTNADTTTMELEGLARGTGYDAWDVTGALEFGGILDLVNLGGFLGEIGDSFTLFNATGGISGDFAAINFAPLGSGDWTEVRTANSYGFEVTGTTAPIPLPAAGWLLIAGLGGLAALRRR